MVHPIYQVVDFQIEDSYILRVHFDDGTHQVIDFEPILEGDLYSPLRDVALFKQVSIDPEVHTLTWPNGADFDPSTLHDWPQHAEAFKEMARKWSLAAAGH